MTLATAGTTAADWSELLELATLRGGFNATIVTIGTTMLGIAAGVIGVFALLRRRSLVADALSHATLPGIAIAFMVSIALGGDGRSLPVLLAGAATSGVVGILAIQAIGRWTRLREDAAIAIVLSVFFGAGVVALSWIQANEPSSSAGLGHFIYGRTASMLPSDAWTMAILAVVVVTLTTMLRREFGLTCFDQDFALANGVPTGIVDLAMLGLVVLVTVAGLQAVGIVLVVAMLVIPPVAARFWTDRLWLLLVLGGGLGGLGGWFGAVVSAGLPNQPAGAVIVLATGAVFAISMLFAPERGVLAVASRRFSLKVRMEGEHLLEAVWNHERDIRDDRPETRHRIFLTMAGERGWTPSFRWVIRKSLLRAGMIDRKAAWDFDLTDKGRRRGATISRNHVLWERYLTSHADVAANHVDWSVDQVEHVLSPDLVSALEETLAADGIDVPPRELDR